MWFIYIVKCADGSFYTGSTNSIDRRIDQHNTSTKGAKYIRTRRPVVLVYSEQIGTRGDALKRENEIKRLSRLKKEELVKKWVASSTGRANPS